MTLSTLAILTRNTFNTYSTYHTYTQCLQYLHSACYTCDQAKRTEFLKVASELDSNGATPQSIGDGLGLIKASLAWYLSQARHMVD